MLLVLACSKTLGEGVVASDAPARLGNHLGPVRWQGLCGGGPTNERVNGHLFPIQSRKQSAVRKQGL